MKRIPFLYRLVRGAIGKRFVVKHYRGGQVVVTRYPDMRGIIPSEEQKRRRRLFTRAVRYARKVYATPALKEERRRLLRRPHRLFQALMKDWFRTQKEKDYRRQRRLQRRLQRWQTTWQHHKFYVHLRVPVSQWLNPSAKPSAPPFLYGKNACPT